MRDFGKRTSLVEFRVWTFGVRRRYTRSEVQKSQKKMSGFITHPVLYPSLVPLDGPFHPELQRVFVRAGLNLSVIRMHCEQSIDCWCRPATLADIFFNTPLITYRLTCDASSSDLLWFRFSRWSASRSLKVSCLCFRHFFCRSEHGRSGQRRRRRYPLS